MSEQGWRDFLSSSGLEDWVVLHGGATAVFETRSLADAAELAERVIALPDATDAGVVLTMTARRLGIRLTRDMWQLEALHVRLAQQISAVARACGATPTRAAASEVQLAVAAKPDQSDVGFWRAVLGYAPASDDNAIDPLGHGSTVWMQGLSDEKDLGHAMHIDVSVPREQAEARVSAALGAGGRVIVDDEAPASWILSDAAGNRVCIAAWPDGAARRG
ncbi:VOC family protein [Microbacterium sp.]|uniref:VOC family protein n=1 Tax=Microbacterium sp. TaxID=51671 RepID=UPI002E31CFDF|nr:VOC family protein [Microbacterium sp.]HEX5730667.1 VOC family protein [Microbacterium sp.]